MVTLVACIGCESGRPGPAPGPLPTAPAERRAAANPAVLPSRPGASAPAAPTALARSYGEALRDGRRLTREGQYAEAIVALRAALAAAPGDPAALNALGWAALLAGDLDTAEGSVRDAVARASEPRLRARCLYNQGRIAEARGRGDEARAAYTESVRLRPSPAVQRRLDRLVAFPRPDTTRFWPSLDALCADAVAAARQQYAASEVDEGIRNYEVACVHQPEAHTPDASVTVAVACTSAIGVFDRFELCDLVWRLPGGWRRVATLGSAASGEDHESIGVEPPAFVPAFSPRGTDVILAVRWSFEDRTEDGLETGGATRVHVCTLEAGEPVCYGPIALAPRVREWRPRLGLRGDGTYAHAGGREAIRALPRTGVDPQPAAAGVGE